MINWKVAEFINLILIVLLGSIYDIRNMDTISKLSSKYIWFLQLKLMIWDQIDIHFIIKCKAKDINMMFLWVCHDQSEE